MRPPAPARRVAARVLERVVTAEAFADLALEAALRRQALADRDAALATELVLGTLRWQRYLDWLLAPLCHRPLETLDPHALVLLRMTAYQLTFLDRIPAYAAVSDAVSLARRRRGPAVAALVNAVLRALARRRARGPVRPLPDDPTEALAIRWSFPSWLAGRWVARWGMTEAEALMRAMNERPPLTLRTNTLRTTREALAERLRREEGLRSRPTQWAPEGLVVERGGQPARWRAFAEGTFAVQDEASMLVSHLLEPRPGQTVADVCAAPGTKTAHLAQLMADRGRLLAFDPQPARLRLVREAAARLGVRCVETRQGTVESLAPELGAVCDAVLVDAPCSNLGVLRRNPEVKWRRQPEDLGPLATRQRTILEAAALMVRPGGRLVYAACSLEPEETDAVAEAFLAACPDFQPDFPARFPLPLDAGVLRCLPHRHGTDGFTAFRFRRKI